MVAGGAALLLVGGVERGGRSGGEMRRGGLSDVGGRSEVVSRLKSKEESAAPLISFLQNSSYVQEHKADKQYNIQMLNDRFKIEALYHERSLSVHWGKLAAEILMQNWDEALESLSVHWGKLAAEILMQNWDEALEELNRLKEIIDSKGDSLCPSFPLHCIKI
ncbi:uncharacterized protein A4U43_C05F24860 [Asparagus officinalis]|uniref:Uncharacterized protein n=1 Tax=Asparagus officinalis TaxID=4686 RepID=A0A5P1EUA8_ASPOF|nr:uncharacterized protein A4U43_C05F24860 [Asparagus officinalis]